MIPCCIGWCAATLLYSELNESNQHFFVVKTQQTERVQQLAAQALAVWADQLKASQSEIKDAAIDRVRFAVLTEVLPLMGYQVGARIRAGTICKEDGKALEKGDFLKTSQHLQLIVQALTAIQCVDSIFVANKSCFSTKYSIHVAWNGKEPDPDQVKVAGVDSRELLRQFAEV